MESQKYQDVYFNEKVGFLDDEASLPVQENEQPCKARMKRIRWRGLKTVASVALFIVVWKSFDAILNPFKLYWGDHAVTKPTEERHMSFDTVRCHALQGDIGTD